LRKGIPPAAMNTWPSPLTQGRDREGLEAQERLPGRTGGPEACYSSGGYPVIWAILRLSGSMAV
jgi:hypothetical protein